MLDIALQHPGSTDDSVIFERSALRVQCEQDHLNIILQGIMDTHADLIY